MSTLDPEAKAAIEIADRHLPGAPPEVRLALAKDILKAMSDFGNYVGVEVIAAYQKLQEDGHLP